MRKKRIARCQPIGALCLLAAFFAAAPFHAARAVSNPAEMLPDRAQELRAEAIGQELRCLVCQNESIEESDADLARDLRAEIRKRVAAGESDKEVIAWMVARYGDFVRLKPPFRLLTLVLWFSPAVALAAGGIAVWFGLHRRPAPPQPLSAAEEARLKRLLREGWGNPRS
jgi:cytochrome c-type biogenesis protein CcmH